MRPLHLVAAALLLPLHVATSQVTIVVRHATVLGIAGSFVGSFVFGLLGFGGVGFVGSVIGAILILWVAKSLNK